MLVLVPLVEEPLVLLPVPLELVPDDPLEVLVPLVDVLVVDPLVLVSVPDVSSSTACCFTKTTD